jgi:hypothetical protein
MDEIAAYSDAGTVRNPRGVPLAAHRNFVAAVLASEPAVARLLAAFHLALDPLQPAIIGPLVVAHADAHAGCMFQGPQGASRLS